MTGDDLPFSWEAEGPNIILDPSQGRLSSAASTMNTPECLKHEPHRRNIQAPVHSELGSRHSDVMRLLPNLARMLAPLVQRPPSGIIQPIYRLA